MNDIILRSISRHEPEAQQEKDKSEIVGGVRCLKHRGW